MSSEPDLQRLTLIGVAHRCAEETDLFFRRLSYDPRYCFELFRRAISEHNARAYELLFTQYRALVTGWVHRHPAFPGSDEEAPYFVNRAFEKLWTALTPEKFAHFGDLKAVLRYLQMCVHSAILDHVRARERFEGEEASETVGERVEAGPGIEQDALAQAGREAFWRHISSRLNNDKERLVIYGCFVLSLKPRDLPAHFPDAFADVRDVYRTKQNVLDRLRRDPELANLVGEDA